MSWLDFCWREPLIVGEQELASKASVLQVDSCIKASSEPGTRQSLVEGTHSSHYIACPMLLHEQLLLRMSLGANYWLQLA